jgi:hypothetical protein
MGVDVMILPKLAAEEDPGKKKRNKEKNVFLY